jgi:ankyrin repeat protein
MGSAYGRTDVVQFLVDQGVEINATNKYGETALFYACYRGYADIAVFLIEQAGCDLEVRNKVTIGLLLKMP